MSDLVIWFFGRWGCGPQCRKDGDPKHPMVHLLWPQLQTSHVSRSTHLNSGTITAPTCLYSCKSLRAGACRSPAGVDVLKVLFIRVSMVGGKRKGGIPNAPQEGYGKNLTEDIPSYGDQCPGYPSRASLGLESCLPV